MKDTRDVFISYRMRSSLRAVEAICSSLEARGISCWYAERDRSLKPISEEIVERIEGCKVFLLVLTKEANRSPHIYREILQAEDYANEHPECKIRFAIWTFDGCKLAKKYKFHLRDYQRFDGGSLDNIDCLILDDLANRIEREIKVQPKSKPPEPSEPSGPPEPPEPSGPSGPSEPSGPPESPESSEPSKPKPTSETSVLTFGRAILFLFCSFVLVVALGYYIKDHGGGSSLPDNSGLPGPDNLPEEEQMYRRAVNLAEHPLGPKSIPEAALIWGKLGDYKDSHEQSLEAWSKCRPAEVLSAGNSAHTEAVFKDGHVEAIGDSVIRLFNFRGWEDVAAVSAGYDHTVGLSNGKAMASGNHDGGKCNVTDSEWHDLIQVSAGDTFTAGLRKDGIIITTGKLNKPLQEASDYVAISAGGTYLLALHADGTVDIWGNLGAELLPNPQRTNPPWANPQQKQQNPYEEISQWRDIIAVSAGYDMLAGLTLDGKVTALGSNETALQAVQNWEHITAISVGGYHIVGLMENQEGKSSNIVVSAGEARDGQRELDDWNNMATLSAGWRHTVGLCEDGTVVYAGPDRDKYDMSAWNGQLPGTESR